MLHNTRATLEVPEKVLNHILFTAHQSPRYHRALCRNRSFYLTVVWTSSAHTTAHLPALRENSLLCAITILHLFWGRKGKEVKKIGGSGKISQQCRKHSPSKQLHSLRAALCLLYQGNVLCLFTLHQTYQVESKEYKSICSYVQIARASL